MGCGCITPASTIHMQNGSYIHSIKVTRIEKGSKWKIGQRYFSQDKAIQNPFSKKEFPSKRTLNFDSKYSSNKNTHGSIKNFNKKPIISIQDFRQSSKKKKNVQFRDQPRLSIKLEAIDKTDFEERGQLKLFQKQNISPKRLFKKPKYLINRVKTQKQQVSPLIEGALNTGKNPNNSKSSQSNSQEVKNFSEWSGKLPSIRRVQTQESDPYLQSLKEIVLFGQTKNQLAMSKQQIKHKDQNTKKSFNVPDVDPVIERLDFKRKKKNFF